MSALPIAAVVLDKDGVTFDSERIYADALLSTLRALPKPYPEPEALAARCSGESSTATAAILQAALGDAVDMKVFFADWFARRDAIIKAHGVPFMPGADALIERLYAEGYPLALVSADDEENVLADFQRSTKPELLQCFSVVITAGNVAKTKPDAEPYLRAAAYLGVDTAQMLAVEDSAVGVQAALAAGCPTLLFAADAAPPAATAQAVLRVIRHHDEVWEFLS